MTVKYGEMTNIVTPVVSIDQYKPKIGEANETVVIAFEVMNEQPAKDLSNLFETGISDTLDVDISQGPNNNGNYMVFVEFSRNKDLYKNIQEILTTASNVTGITEWRFNHYKGEQTLDLNEDNLTQSVLDNPEEYMLRYMQQSDTTNESLLRLKTLAGLYG